MLSEVKLSTDVFLACCAHALSNEREEIMGMLIGERLHTENGMAASVCALHVLKRTDKRPDRVEVSSQQLVEGQQAAERLSQDTGIDLRPIGWYHSHPHITIQPSHVDLATQATYQLMDQGWIGLIFSVFNEDAATHQGSLQVIAFQSLPDRSPHQLPVSTPGSGVARLAAHIPITNIARHIPGHFFPARMVELQQMLLEEEKEAFYDAVGGGSLSDANPLLLQHHSAVYLKSLCRHIDLGCLPLLHVLEGLVEKHSRELDELNAQLRDLQHRQ